jgi:Mrp family chromosome partitioning ATPase
MTPGGAETLKAAIRRSLPLILGLVVIGIVAVNVFERISGPEYQASARVEVSATPLAEILTQTTPPVLDPTEVQSTAQTLAEAPQVYKRAAFTTDYRYGTAATLRDATSVSAVNNTDLLSFSSRASNQADAIAITNATAGAYVAYEAALNGSKIAAVISQLQSGSGPASASPSLKGDINRLELLKGTSSSVAQVVQPALSANKTSPEVVKDSLLGLAVGLVVALVLVALREAIDTTVRSEAEVEELLGAPVLASVRPLPRRTQIVTLGRFEPMYGDSYALLGAQLAPERRGDERSIIAFTSAVAGEGKTTTVANLGVSLAKRGHRVALADFDFHRPTLAKLFEIPDGVAGTVQVLQGSETLESTLWEVSLDGARAIAKSPADSMALAEQRTPAVARDLAIAGVAALPGVKDEDDAPGSLAVLPSGGSPASTTQEMTVGMPPLLHELRSHADIVILDTPPALLTVEMTELAQVIDMVVVVVRQGLVSQRLLRSLGRHAKGWRAELIGAVLTDLPSPAGYASYYGSS